MIRFPAKSILVIVSSIAILFFKISFAEAWQVITHYQLGVQSGVDPNGSFQNLPDSWPSHGGIRKLFEITEWFAWSHAVLRTGRTSGVPNVPVYPSDDRDPGKIMYRLYLSGAFNGPYAFETVIGFLAHNVQDHQVHYRYFRGGSRAAWREEHEWKEMWADCWIYRVEMGGEFDKQGRPRHLPKIDNRGNSELISRAQAEFIASGLSTDVDQTVMLPEQETVKKIDTRISDYQQEINGYLAKFNLPHCESLAKSARNYAWTLDELQEYYEKSLHATRKVLTDFPPPPASPPGGLIIK